MYKYISTYKVAQTQIHWPEYAVHFARTATEGGNKCQLRFLVSITKRLSPIQKKKNTNPNAHLQNRTPKSAT